MEIDKVFNNDVDGVADNLFSAVKNSVSEIKAMQQRKAAENVQLVIRALKKLETELRETNEDVANQLALRIASIKDGRDGKDGKNGKDGRDGKAGRDGKDGNKGDKGADGRDGVDGLDGVSVVNANIDFDGSLVITLSDGRVINVGEVVASDLAERIKVISTMSTNGAIAVKEEGTTITNGVKSINFVGAGITATTSGDDVTVTVASGSGTVTSVAATVPTFLSVTGSPITTSGTLAISLSGTALPVANGGTGITSFGTGVATFLGTPSSANLAAAVTDETGTGALVFATSPTLVTPILGTPTSGTLTNATGLPISTGVSGLGTGVATALAVNVGSAGAPVVNGGALGTPSSGTVTNLTGTASININGTVGATTASTGAFTTLSATGVTTVQAGTAALPAITTTGDTNTGIFFPAADTIAFSEGGVEAARIDSSGNFGLGVTPSAWDNRTAFQNGSACFASSSANRSVAEVSANSFLSTGGIFRYLYTSANATLYQQATGTHVWYTAPSGTAGNAITFTQAMTLDASGNLLVGTTTANANFYVYNAPVSYAGLNATAIFSSSASQSTGTGGLLAFEGKYNSGGSLANFAAIGGLKENSTDNNYSGYLGFYTRLNGNLPAERARIDSSGNLLVGTTSFVYTATGTQISDGQINIGSAGTGGSTLMNFGNGNGAVGSISVTGSATSYNTSSDYRLKNITGTLTGAKDFIMALKPKQGTWKVDGSAFVGFLAHEFQEVSPSSVSGEKDAVDVDGKPIMQAMQASSSEVMANLVAFVQEQQALITQLTARITALEGA